MEVQLRSVATLAGRQPSFQPDGAIFSAPLVTYGLFKAWCM